MRSIRKDILYFLLLEIIAVFLTIQSNKKKEVFVFNTFSKITSGIYSFSYNVKNYLSLKEENKILTQTNKKLLNDLLNCSRPSANISYNIISAHVLKNSVNQKNNLILLSAGRKQGVKKEAAVVSDKGNVVGFVIDVGKNYSAALSLLNNISHISVKHKKSGAFGTLIWRGDNPRYMLLEEIPGYIKIHIGDTIVTSGYSNIFPEGLTVGTVSSVEKTKEQNTYRIKVKLAEDPARLNNVFIINTIGKEELDSVLTKAKKIIGE